MNTIKQLPLLACLISTTANAIEFQAYAPVLNVEPLTETRYESVTRRVCTEPDRSARTFATLAATIGEDIRNQSRLWQQQRSCRNMTEQRAREHVTGYQVTYRYGGEIQTTILSHDPGDRMPVSVSLSPFH